MTRSLSLALVLGALFVPAPAAAQPVPPQPLSQDLQLITLHQSQHSGFDTPRTAVITNMADLRAYFAGSNVDLGPQPRVDFVNEDVLVAATGTRPTGGYSVAITKVTLMTGGFTRGHAFVEVTETTPAPGSIVTMALTSPIHVVRVPKGAIAYHFNAVPPRPAGFEALDLTRNVPITQYNETVHLEASGLVTLSRSSPTARYAQLTGQATADELRAVQAAFAAADVATLPGFIPDPRLFIVAPENYSLVSTLPGGVSHTTGANVGWYTPYEARFEPLLNALRAIGDRLLQNANFERVTLRWSGGFAAFSDEVTVHSDGTAVVNRTGFVAGAGGFWNGQATPAELTALLDAVSAADLPGLPDRIDDPVQIMDIPSLTIVGAFGGVEHTTLVMEAGFYDVYQARLEPVVAAVRAISERLILQGERTFTGEVRRSGAYLFVAGHRVTWNEPLARLLAQNAGRTVTVKGRLVTRYGIQWLDVATVQATTTANLNLRTQPRYGAPVMRVLPRGTVVQVKEPSSGGSWMLVQEGQDSGWVFATYLRVGS